MATSLNTYAAHLEGHFTNRPLLFDGTNYQFWSTRRSIFVRSCNYLMWDVVVDGLCPHEKIRESEDQIPNQRSEWTNDEMKKIQINFKAINTLHYALNPIEFNRISTCKTTKKSGIS